MAVAFDAATESSTWTTTPDPFTFDHTPSGTPRAALLAITNSTVTDVIDGPVTYGGVEMTRIASLGGDMDGEPGRVYWFFLDDVASGTQTVSIGHTASAAVKIATAITLTGDGPLYVVGVKGSCVDALTANNNHWVMPTAGTAARFVNIFSGVGTVGTMVPLSGMTAVSSHDYGNNITRVDRETSTSTSFDIGYSNTGDNLAGVAVAVSETEQVQPAVYQWMDTAQATSHLINQPPTEADDLLMVGIVAGNNGGTWTTPTDWSRFDSGGGNSTILPGFFYLECDGTESGDVDFVSSSGTNSTICALLYHVPAVLRDTAVAPEAQITGPTGSGTPDPDGLTPSWGSAANHWFNILLRDANDGISSLGANYATNFVYNNQTGTATTEQAGSWWINTASSEDPPAATVGSTDEEWIQAVIAVKPPGDDSVTGTGASTLDGVSADGAASVNITGTGASTLGGVTADGTGIVAAPVSGSGDSTLDGVTADGSGSVIAPVAGTGASTLAGVTADGTGTLAVLGAGTTTLGGVTADGVGIVANPATGSGAVTLDGVTSDGVAEVLLPGTIGNAECVLVGPDAECVLVGPSGFCDSTGPMCITTMED